MGHMKIVMVSFIAMDGVVSKLILELFFGSKRKAVLKMKRLCLDRLNRTEYKLSIW